MNNSNEPIILKAMSRKQLARNYGISTRTLYRRLKDIFGDRFIHTRTFLPKQVAEICTELGYWTEYYSPSQDRQ